MLVVVVRLGVHDFKLGRKLNIENGKADFVHVQLQMKIILIQNKRKLRLTVPMMNQGRIKETGSEMQE